MTKYRYTAQYYDFVLTTLPGGGEGRTYTYNKMVKFNGGGGISSGLTVYTKEPWREFARIDLLKDSKGNMVMPWEKDPVGATYEVRSSQPMLNFWGTIEGYKISLVRI